MLLAFFLLFLHSVKTYMVLGPPQVEFKEEGTLSLLLIQVPQDYRDFLEEKKIEKIDLSHTTFTEEIAQDLVQKFSQWKDLGCLTFNSCNFTQNSAEILAKGLVTSRHIGQIEFHQENGFFLGRFIKELASVPAYLKKMKIVTSKYFTEDDLALNDVAVTKDSFSAFENLDLYLYPGIDSALFARILPLMQNLKGAGFTGKDSDSMQMLHLIANPGQMESLELPVNDQTLENFLQFLPKMKNLLELKVHVGFEKAKLGEFITALGKRSIRQLHLSGNVDQQVLHSLKKFKSLEFVSVPFSLYDNEAVSRFEFRFKNKLFPFEVEGKYVRNPNPNIQNLQSGFDIFGYGLSQAKVFLVSDKIDPNALQVFQDGRGDTIEEFELHVSCCVLKNFGDYLTLMPNLRRLKVVNTGRRNRFFYNNEIVENLNPTIEELHFEGEDSDYMNMTVHSYRHRFKKLKQITFEDEIIKKVNF